MAFKNGFRLWDDEFEREHWTPEEIAESNAKVTKIGDIIRAEQQGYISHEEAMIRHLTLDPDLAEIMLNDATETGDVNEIRKVQLRIDEAKARAKENNYWNSVLEHAERTAKSGYNLDSVINTLGRAIGILQSAVQAGA